MKTILLFGAGKSATVLIEYLLEQAPANAFRLQVVDADPALARGKTAHSSYGEALSFDVNDPLLRREAIAGAFLVISLLPPHLHHSVAVDCLELKKHLFTASYVSDEIRSMTAAIEKAGVLFLCEMGLDPGIDHMSAMSILDKLREDGATIDSFVSHCGGLIAPESDDNPWHYKITWNPRNVVTAGRAGARFRRHHQSVLQTQQEMFRLQNRITVAGIGEYGWYPNRDSLSYLPLYGLESVDTFIRTTLRHPDFLRGWEPLLSLGLTEDEPLYTLPSASLAQAFTHHFSAQGLLERLSGLLKEDPRLAQQITFLGIHDTATLLPFDTFSPAQLLQFALEKKLTLHEQDKDMIVMVHEIEFRERGKNKKITSQLLVKGTDPLHTAMAKTVGLPLAIAALLLIRGQLPVSGLQVPIDRVIYEPVLSLLKKEGIVFTDTVTVSH